MNRPEAVKLFSELLDARERGEHQAFFAEHLEDICDAAILAVADIDSDDTEWFGIVRWCEEDISTALQNDEIDPTPNNIAEVMNRLGNHAFEDLMIERGWDCIHDVIHSIDFK